MDFSAILAEKDAEILVLRAEIAELRSKLQETDLEEIAFETDISDEEEPMKLRLPQEDEEQDENMFENPNALMQLMQLMMMNNNNNNSQMDEEGDDDNDFEGDNHEEEMPELEFISDIIPESD